MKNNKVLFLMILTFMLILAACSGKKSSGPETPEIDKEDLKNFNETGMPIVNEPITLKFMAGKSALSSDNYNETLLWKTYEEMTNIHIDWELIPTSPSDSRDEKRNLALAGGTMPDVFYTMSMPNEDLLKYGQQEIFVKMNDLIEEYMPNLSALLEQYPEIGNTQGGNLP